MYRRIPFSGPLAAAFLNAALIWATVAGFARLAVKSTIEPVGTGTRKRRAVELALHRRQHQARGPGRTGATSG